MRGGGLLALALLGVAIGHAQGSEEALNVGGNYSNSMMSTCDCWRWRFVPDHCGCASAGCPYLEQVTLTKPDERGWINMTMSAGADQSCYSKTEGPYQAHVDQCGHILGGSRGEEENKTLFDPDAVDQVMDTIVVGDVLGFGREDAGFRHTVVTRWNMSLCAPNGRCFGGERFMCIDKFHTCSSGDCYEESRDEVSTPDSAYFQRLSTTGLTGKYTLVEDGSSSQCPSDISAFHFGTQLGLGSSKSEMRMTRLVDKSMAASGPNCVQFNTVCSGLQFHQYHQDMMYAGRFTEDGWSLRMTLYMIRAQDPDNNMLAVEKCVFRGESSAPRMLDNSSQTGAVVGLSIMLAICIIVAAAMGFFCLRYRRRFLDSRMDSAYNAFET